MTLHATERFIERVAPSFTRPEARAYLTELAATYGPHQGFEGRCAVDSRFGPLVLTVARVDYLWSGHMAWRVVLISVWPLTSDRSCRRGVRRLTA